jgi:PHP family Zn ribbon phosphoesterase
MGKTLIIKAVKKENGYTLIANNGDQPTEGRVVSTREKAYAECDAMYNNATWQGCKVKSGYRIVID